MSLFIGFVVATAILLVVVAVAIWRTFSKTTHTDYARLFDREGE